MRLSLAVLAAVATLAACASPPEPPPALGEAGRPEGPPVGWQTPDVVLQADLLRVLGPAVVAQVKGARQAIVVRGPTSFPRMIQQADGSWQAEPPPIVAAVREAADWTRITAGGRATMPASASRELDRISADRTLWSEAETPPGTCTDPSGMLVLVRSEGRERVSAHPCGFSGVSGKLGALVLAGEITDWRDLAPADRPAGLPLKRFDEQTSNLYRYSSGITDERRVDIRSASEWEAQWARLTAGQGPSRPPPAVDFGRDMVLLAAMGTRPSGGYQVTIDRVIETRAGLEVDVRHTSPGRGCGVTAALTRPADVVLAPASPQTVHWVVEQTASDCGR